MFSIDNCNDEMETSIIAFTIELKNIIINFYNICVVKQTNQQKEKKAKIK